MDAKAAFSGDIDKSGKSVLKSLVEKSASKKDDDLKVEKTDPKKDHKEDIREAFTGHVKLNTSKTAGPIPEKAKGGEAPTANSVDAKTAISGNTDKNGKNIAKLVTEKKTGEKTTISSAPANKAIESPKIASTWKPTLVAKKVAQFSSHSTSPFFDERHHQENEPLIEAPSSA